MKQEKQNPFIKYNGIKDAKVHIHKTSGLYDASNEHDACGVGMIVDIHGNKSHELVDSALKVLENMKHRGAEGADNKTGDGAGIMLQIPHEFILLQGIPVPEKGKYGTGLVFLPKDEQEQSHMLSVMIEEIEREGLNLMHLRNVPVNSSILGKDASATEPSIKQIFITGSTNTENLERTLYIIRKRIENRIHHKDFYIVSLSSKNIVYKGMLSSVQVREYFPDLTQPYFTSGLAVVHSRFRAAAINLALFRCFFVPFSCPPNGKPTIAKGNSMDVSSFIKIAPSGKLGVVVSTVFHFIKPSFLLIFISF